MIIIIGLVTFFIGIYVGYQIDRHPQYVEHTEMKYDAETEEFVPFDEPDEDKALRKIKAEQRDLMRMLMDDGPELDFDDEGRRVKK